MQVICLKYNEMLHVFVLKNYANDIKFLKSNKILSNPKDLCKCCEIIKIIPNATKSLNLYPMLANL